MMLRTVPSEKCTEIVVGEDHLDEESSELKANLEFELKSSYDAETSRDFKREDFEAVEKAGYEEDLNSKLKVDEIC